MRKRRILIADGDTDLCRCYFSILGNAYEIVLATSGQRAVMIARQPETIDLVLLEYRLRDISGLDVLREIKKCRPSVPVLLMTAYGNEDVAVRAFRYGARDYLRKPVGYDDLMSRIAFYLSLATGDKEPRQVVCPEDHPLGTDDPVVRDIASSHRLNIQKAMRFVDDNFMAKISLAAVADKACMSRHHFSRVFRKTTCVSYQEYVTGRRVQKAKELLQDPRCTVTEIAHIVGYSDVNNLVRNFRKLTGRTPSGFRNDLLHASVGNDPRKR